MQLHHVHEHHVERWIVDPALGPVKRRDPVVKQSDTHAIVHEGVQYDRDENGNFEVPEEVGQFYINRVDGWHEGPSPFPAQIEDVVPSHGEGGE